MQGDLMDGGAYALCVDNTDRYLRDFPSTPEAIRTTLQSVTQYLHRHAEPEDVVGSVEIVLAELFNNIGQHGYDEVGDISLQLSRQKEGLVCTIADHGESVPSGFFCPALAHPSVVPAEALPVNGFGGYLIRALARKIRYQHTGKGNIVTFEIPTLQ